MKKVLLLMFLLVSMGVNAQSELHNAIKNYVKACPAVTESFENSMKQALTLVNEKFIEDYNVQQSEALIKKYCGGPFLDDFIESMMIPCSEGIATVSDFQALTKMMLTPEGKTLQAHQAKMNSVGTKWIQQKTVDIVNMLMEGKTPPAEKVRQEIPQSYRQLYYQFFKVSKLEKTISPMMSIILKDVGEDKKELMQKFTNYLNENLRTLYINSSYDYLTTADLNFAIKCFSLPAYEHVSLINEKLPEKVQSGSLSLVMAYINWLESQGVKIKK